MHKKACLTLLIIFAFSYTAYADPQIVNIEGSARHGQHIVVHGSDFGNKSPAAPLVWDDFENGRNGAELTGWELFKGTSGDYSAAVFPKYTDSVSFSGSSILCGFMHTPGPQYDCAAYRRNLGHKREVYASYRFCIEHISGPDSWNIKMLRLVAGYPGFNTGTPSISVTLGLNVAANVPGENETQNLKWAVPWQKQTWYRWEYYLDVSDPIGQANGHATMWIDRQAFWDFAGVTMTAAATQEGGTYSYVDTVVLPFFAANGENTSDNTPNEYKIYYDDVYIDDTLARVEIGDQPTWSACTKREIQIPIAWENNQVTLQVNQGELGYGDAYLFVVDENDVPSLGCRISLEQSPEWLAGAIQRWQNGDFTREVLNRAIYWFMKGVMPAGDPLSELTEEDIGNAFKLAE